MSLTKRILVSLVTGLVVGVVVARFAGGLREEILTVATTVGAAWIGGLRMTIVPLVFALLVTGIASAADAARSGGVAARTLLYFAIGLSAAALMGGLITETILWFWPISEGAIRALGTTATVVPPEATAINAAWFLGFIPTNPIKSAAESEMVPLVVFAMLFGFAATRIASDRRIGLTNLLQSIVDTLLVIVHWVLWLAPIGVFALATAAGARAGASAAGALVQYLVIVVAACVAVTLLIYPVVVIAGRIGLRDFVQAAAPAQAIAFSTQSSVASLPAMIEATGGPLAVPEPVRNMVLPMAVSIFRVTSAAANFAVALYVAALHGIEISPALFVVGVLVATVVSLAAVGLPSQISFFTALAPVCLAIGAPIEVLPLLLAVETVPDIFRTVGNVTADLGVTRIVTERSRSGDAPV